MFDWTKTCNLSSNTNIPNVVYVGLMLKTMPSNLQYLNHTKNKHTFANYTATTTVASNKTLTSASSQLFTNLRKLRMKRRRRKIANFILLEEMTGYF